MAVFLAWFVWIRRFILYHDKKHPKDMGPKEVEAFLTHLALHGKVAASTQNQAFNALLFLYEKVLELDVIKNIDAYRAKRPQRVPTVLTFEEVIAIIDAMSGTTQLIAKVLYGCGLRGIE
jgi:integrase